MASNTATQPSGAPVSYAAGHIPRHVWVVCGVVIVGMIMSILDTTIVNVALNTLSRELHSPLAQVQWVITGYLLSLAAVIPVSGWAARRFGAKQVYLVSLVLFTAGSALCGLASSITTLVVFRVLQGMGGGMIMPLAMMIMAKVAGPQQMGKVMGVVSMPAMIAPILGPVVGGAILEHLHWSWIFFVNVPIGAIAFVLGARMLPRIDHGEAGRLDLLGLALLPTGFAALIYGVSELGSGAALGSGEVILPVIAGLVLTVLFCFHALRAERPLLDIRMYANRVFAGAAFTNFGLGAALFGAMILVPLYYQTVRGMSVIDTGLLTGPQGIGALAAMPLASRLTERFGGGRVALGGVTVLCLSTIPFAFVGANTSIVAISAVLVVRGLSIGLCFMPAMTAAFASMRPEQVSDATPQINALQRLGGAIGTAILAVVLQRATASHIVPGQAPSPAHLASAFDTAYVWALGIAALTLIPCLMLLRAENPRATEVLAAGGGEAAMEPAGV
ncbi:MAG TPA: MDR family MFS transporter [Solirubrobacteraceae bacterium]|jgi:EmrB/QacA subfamily drug resistance transporter|nr:MDR family MFS transporter [Solirubrobacteraceae bacterium]